MEHKILMHSREDNLISNLFRALQVYIALILLSENSLRIRMLLFTCLLFCFDYINKISFQKPFTFTIIINSARK